MRAVNDEFLTLRLPAGLRRDLDAATAHAQGIGRSEFIRRAVVRAISSPDQPDPTPPAAPGARPQMPVVA